MFESNLANLTTQYQQAYLIYCYKVMQYLQVLAWMEQLQRSLQHKVSPKTASDVKKLAPNQTREKLKVKSLKYQRKVKISTILVSGYTDHEMVDAFGIINMGGRIYDAALGRVLQADPFVQDPTNTQSFNRYTYVFNNPLSYTDPSGYFSLRQALGIIIGAVLTFYLGPLGAKMFSAGWAAFIGGFVSGAIITGSLKGAIVGGLMAMATAAVFQGTENFFTKAPAVNAGTGAAAGATGDVIFKTSFSGANPTVGGISATNIASGAAATGGSAKVVTEVGISIAGKAVEDVVALGRITVIGTPITFRQIIAEAIFYQSLAEITRDMIEASFEGYATDTDMATVNAFRISTDGLQEAYAIVAKEIRIRQFQTAFLINTINAVSLVSGAGAVVTVGKGVAGRLLFGAGGRTKVFWTGSGSKFTSDAVKQKASEFAISRGAVTIDMTIGGRALASFENSFGSLMSKRTINNLWAGASRTFARNANGTAFVFQTNRGVILNSIWATAEQSILQQNNVRLIFYIIRFGF